MGLSQIAHSRASCLLGPRPPPPPRSDGRVTELMPELQPRRAARDAFVLPREVLPDTAPFVARIVARCMFRREGKFFAKPPHEIWRDLGEGYYAASE